jgi:hypothetical protein
MEQEFATFRYKNGRVYRTDAHTLAVMQDVKAWDAQAAEGIFDRGLQTGRIAESFDRAMEQAEELGSVQPARARTESVGHAVDADRRGLMTGERVREIMRVAPQEAVVRGWVKEDHVAGVRGYRAVPAEHAPTIEDKTPRQEHAIDISL